MGTLFSTVVNVRRSFFCEIVSFLKIFENMKNTFYIFGLFLLQVVVGKLDDNILGAQGANLMKELKDSGVLDSFEQELEKMLHQEKAKEDAGKANEKSGNTKEEKPKVEVNFDKELREFIQSYVEENKINLDSRILDHLASLPISESGKTKHMVHLTKVLDTIFEIAVMNNHDLDKKVIDVIKRVQSLPVMRTSLTKLIETSEEEPVVVETVKSNPIASTNDDDLGVLSMVKDFILKLKKKPDFIFELLLPTLVDYGLVSKDSVQMLKMYGASFVKSESFGLMLDTFANSLDTFASSAGGKRLVALLPDILAAENTDAIMEIFQKEAENSWTEFLSKLDSSDVADQVVKSLGSGMVHTYNYVRDLTKDDMKMALANTFLISYGLPSIKPRKLTASIFDLVDKSLKVFTTYKLDLQEYKDETLKQIALIEKQYITANDYAKLTEQEQITLVSRFLSENVLEPLQYIWTAHKQITTHVDGPKCAESILCHLNAHMRTQGSIKMTITKVISLAASYGWSADDKSLDRWKLYQAIWNGNAPETKCSTQYTPTGLENSCHIFPWQESMMSLNFEHTEL